MNKRTATTVEPNLEDPKVARLTSMVARKGRVVGTLPNGDRVAYVWDSMTVEWRRDWDFGSAAPVRSFGMDTPAPIGFATD